MDFFDDNEKLITEHSSAVITKERIDLAKDQCAALEKKLSASERWVKQLIAEKQRFELENLALKEKIRILEKQFYESNDTSSLEELRKNSSHNKKT